MANAQPLQDVATFVIRSNISAEELLTYFQTNNPILQNLRQFLQGPQGVNVLLNFLNGCINAHSFRSNYMGIGQHIDQSTNPIARALVEKRHSVLRRTQMLLLRRQHENPETFIYNHTDLMQLIHQTLNTHQFMSWDSTNGVPNMSLPQEMHDMINTFANYRDVAQTAARQLSLLTLLSNISSALPSPH